MTTKTEQTNAPSALMLLSSHCAHCPGVLDSLAKLIKSGDLGELRVINLEQHPEAMQEYKVRSVPWVRIGKHEITGAQPMEAFKQRIEWAKKEQSADDNTAADFDFLLSDSQANKVIEAIKKDPHKMDAIMDLLADPRTVLSTRIGIGVVFEEFSGTELLKKLIPKLAELARHEDSRIRADAVHYLGMTADKEAIPILEAAKEDSDSEIREIAADSLEAIQEALANG